MLSLLTVCSGAAKGNIYGTDKCHPVTAHGNVGCDSRDGSCFKQVSFICMLPGNQHHIYSNYIFHSVLSVCNYRYQWLSGRSTIDHY